ncbi:O-antigen ligase family protein [Microbacterium allomyrinae]|uniref:O-antigen ligase family protein n=1 Tax=Microbacterium allomyrinae TaxID=2830666 RepID=A0A9X1LXK3_9MICO|nr:O-antigen ligase family protein [Microbacterium allomyrinae]MCC2033588.1 O-antigen ligase family protein [Microbacterium allomyrinae]
MASDAPTDRSSSRRSRWRDWLSIDIAVLLAVAWLLIGPRVELIPFASSSIRLEDVIFVALAIFVAVSGWRRIRDTLGTGMLIATAGVLAVGLISATLGVISGRVEIAPSLLYALRPLEYWIVLPAVLLGLRTVAGRTRRIVLMLGAVTVLQTSVGMLQIAGIPIGFSKFTYERAAGLTAGPYELGAICAMLACFWLFRRQYVLAVVALAGLVASQSRVSIVAVAFGLVVLLLGVRKAVARTLSGLWRNHRATVLLVGGGLLVVSVATVTWFGAPVVDRLAGTSIFAAWEDAQRFSQSIPPPATAEDFGRVAYGQIDVVLQGALIDDVSNVVRFFRWQLLIAAIAASPLAVFFGLGPSFAGPSVDGSFLRIVVEFGLAGLAAWGYWLYRSVQGARVWILAVLTTLLIGSAVIDLLFALRPMVLFWFLVAVAWLDAPSRRRSDLEGSDA